MRDGVVRMCGLRLLTGGGQRQSGGCSRRVEPAQRHAAPQQLSAFHGELNPPTNLLVTMPSSSWKRFTWRRRAPEGEGGQRTWGGPLRGLGVLGGVRGLLSCTVQGGGRDATHDGKGRGSMSARSSQRAAATQWPAPSQGRMGLPTVDGRPQLCRHRRCDRHHVGGLQLVAEDERKGHDLGRKDGGWLGVEEQRPSPVPQGRRNLAAAVE
jgi:hypothetical protein